MSSWRRRQNSSGIMPGTEISLIDAGPSSWRRLSIRYENLNASADDYCLPSFIYVQVLMAHIRDKLPDMKARLNTLMGQTQQELNAFGDSTFLGEQHRGSLILKLMTQFVRDFVASIDGTSLEISTKELCGGARIYYIFNDVFGHALESINPTHNLTVQDIRTAIRNSTGPRPSLFVPEVAFDLLVKPQIKLLEPPSLRCVELVYEELMKICHNCTSSVSMRCRHLCHSITDSLYLFRNYNATPVYMLSSSRSFLNY